jgi:hypothetical protein
LLVLGIADNRNEENPMSHSDRNFGKLASQKSETRRRNREERKTARGQLKAARRIEHAQQVADDDLTPDYAARRVGTPHFS